MNYIHGRRRGTITSMKTSIRKLDSAFLKGIEWNNIMTIGGLSGCGKSLLLEQLKRGFVDANPDQKFHILSFELEMLAITQVTRNISGKLNKSMQELYSAANTDLTDKDLDNIRTELDKMTNYPIYYIDDAVTVKAFEKHIYDFAEDMKLDETGEGLIITLDHSLLVEKSVDQKSDKDVIDAFYKRLIAIKRDFYSRGMKIIFIVAAQLNRNLESSERITKQNLQYPTKNDFFGASSTFYSSDYVIIQHKPAVIEGIGQTYGPGNLPVFHPKYEKPMIYLHILKNRVGKLKILTMLDNFENSEILEVNL